jgi:hypothetical protein
METRRVRRKTLLLWKRGRYKEKHYYGNEEGTKKSMEMRRAQRKTLLWKRGRYKEK